MTSCTKSKRTSSPDAPAKCRDVENASAFLARVQSDYRLMSNVSREKSFNFGCVIRFTLQCSSSRLSETSGQYESEITIALLRRNTAISSSGFGSARTKTTTTSSSSCGSR